MESLVNQLPEVNRAVLCFLLEFLNEITAKARENACADEHACARSLAWVFAQACLRPDIKHGQSLATRGECEVVMVQLIMQNKQLFSSGSEGKDTTVFGVMRLTKWCCSENNQASKVEEPATSEYSVTASHKSDRGSTNLKAEFVVRKFKLKYLYFKP